MDYVLVDGDTVVFEPSFGAATVVVQPGTIRASGPSTLGQKRWCIEGDHESVVVAGCSYFTASHPIPGTGTIAVGALASDQLASKTHDGGAKVLLVGDSFTAKFSVQSPAQQPTPSGAAIPDATPEYSGSGRFIGTNSRFRAS